MPAPESRNQKTICIQLTEHEGKRIAEVLVHLMYWPEHILTQDEYEAARTYVLQTEVRGELLDDHP